MLAATRAHAVNELRLLGASNTNKLMAGELNRLAQRALGRRPPEPRKQGTGALIYPFEPELAALAVRYHRTSARVLWDLFVTDAARLEPLYEGLFSAAAEDARAFVWDGARISVMAFGVGGFAAGERQIVGTVKNALIDAARARGIHIELDPEHPHIEFSVRMPEPGCILVSVDLAGRPMHQRGYRLLSGEAPLREDLAAQLVMLSRYDARREALIDPMAGSGTIAIEAVCMARARSVWQSGRTPAAVHLPEFKPFFTHKARPLFPDTEPIVIANELDARTFGALEKNCKTAGVEHTVFARNGDFRGWPVSDVFERIRERGGNPNQGVILTNPPYGHRLTGSVAALYREFRSFCRNFPGFRLGVMVANPEFEAVFGRARIRKPIRNGPLSGYFLLYDL